jgi:hypothetical protein
VTAQAKAEMMEIKLSEETTGQQISDEVAKFEPTVEWKFDAIGDEVDMGDQIHLPIEICDEKEMQQQRRLQKKSQSVDQLNKDIEKMRRIMIESSQHEVNNKRKLNRGEHAKIGK